MIFLKLIIQEWAMIPRISMLACGDRTTGNLQTLGQSDAKKFLTSQIIIQSSAESYQ